MKILIATGLYSPEIGGPATYVKLLEEDLPGLGFNIEVIPFSDVRSYPKFLRHVIYGWKIWQAAKQTDVVYALDPVSVGLPAMLAARLRGKPFVLRLGGDYAWEQGRVRYGVTQTLEDFVQDTAGQPLVVRVLCAIQTYVAKHAVRIVVPSEYLKKIVMFWGVQESKVEIIYSTLFPLELVKQSDAPPQLHHPVIVTAGRLVPWKGILTLVKVVRRMTNKYPDVLLQVIGDGPQLPQLQAYIAKYNLERHVQLLGRLPKAELAQVITSADMFVLNTAYEGLSHQLLEVMDLGVPIITTTAGGNTELLSHGVDSLLVSFDDREALRAACERLIHEPQTAHRLTQFARARTKDFSRKQAVHKIATLLHNL